MLAARCKYGTQKVAKNRHLGTIVSQLCRAISSQLRHVSTIGKKLLRQQYLPRTSSQYGELRPTSVWHPLASLGHPSKFQRVSRLGSVTAWHSISGRQPNCGVQQWAPPVGLFGRAAIALGIGPHSSLSIPLVIFPLRIDPLHFQTRGPKRWPSLGFFLVVLVPLML